MGLSIYMACLVQRNGIPRRRVIYMPFELVQALLRYGGKWILILHINRTGFVLSVMVVDKGCSLNTVSTPYASTSHIYNFSRGGERGSLCTQPVQGCFLRALRASARLRCREMPSVCLTLNGVINLRRVQLTVWLMLAFSG